MWEQRYYYAIQYYYTVAYNLQTNGVAKIMNKTLFDEARTVLLESNMSKELPGEAILCCICVLNRSLTSNKEETPSEMREGRKPNVCNLRVFSSIA